jgi:hypothetical protein
VHLDRFQCHLQELIMHVRNETSTKKPAAIKTKEIRHRGDVYLTEYVPTDVTIDDQ